MNTFLVIALVLLGLYVVIGLTYVVVDTLERRRKRSIRLSVGDICLFAIAWPLVLYIILRGGYHLDNT